MNIENNLTQIWIGPNPAPLKWMYTWRDKHPGWNYSIFTDEMLKSRRWINQDLIERYYQLRAWCGVSDLIRYELLYERGGFWPEADMICLNDTTELFTSPKNHCYTCYENEEGRPDFVQPIMACNPRNDFVRYIIETLRQLRPNDLHRQPHKSTGNEFLSKHIGLFKNEMTIWPSHWFIPQFYVAGAKRYDGPDKIYADHKWGSTGMHAHCAQYSDGVL